MNTQVKWTKLSPFSVLQLVEFAPASLTFLNKWEEVVFWYVNCGSKALGCVYSFLVKGTGRGLGSWKPNGHQITCKPEAFEFLSLRFIQRMKFMEHRGLVIFWGVRWGAYSRGLKGGKEG